jgi:hypothetical protein
MTQEEKFMKNVTDKLIQMRAYETREQIANKKNITDIDALVNLVNAILSNHGITDTINKSQIRFNADYIGNISKIKDKKLSNIILDAIYPKPTRKVFSHYTKFDKGLNIIESKEFWMFSLLQNFTDSEFQLFYQEHNIDGYNKERETFGVRTGYRPLMSEIFALCLTTEENTSPTLWQYFAESCTGLKLTFEVLPQIPDFREVYYSNRHTREPIPLLKDLFSEIETSLKQPFNFTYMSKVGAFYIKGDFENEQEFRFLIKRESDDYDARDLQPIPYNADVSYIILPFFSKFATFHLIKVEKGPNCDPAKFNAAIPMIQRIHPGVQIIT